jgi:hypothetical protein
MNAKLKKSILEKLEKAHNLLQKEYETNDEVDEDLLCGLGEVISNVYNL